jgi:hypothetical protein
MLSDNLVSGRFGATLSAQTGGDDQCESKIPPNPLKQYLAFSLKVYAVLVLTAASIHTE